MNPIIDTNLVLNRTIPPPIKDAVEFNLTLKPYTKYALSNGAPVYYINDGTEEVALVEIVFNAGNSFENKNLIASATNYLLKNGTSKKTALEINEHFEYYGAYLNRTCNNETTVLTLHCLSKHLNVLLPVIKEILTDSVFPEEELAIFKQNSIQHLSVNLKKCDFVANRLIDQYLYGAQHPYGRVSSVEDIQAITREDLVNFFANFYRKASCKIFAAGKLPADFENLLNESFGELHLNENITSVIHKTEMVAEKKSRINNDPNGVQGAVRIARPFPNRHHPDFKRASVLNTLFGGFFGSRLMSNIREEKGYTYGIHSFLENHIRESAWVISTEAGKDVCEATIEEVYKEMKILREELIDDEELLLVKNYIMGAHLGDIDGPFQVIARWKSLILNDLDETYFYDSMSTIKNISAEELKELANKYLQPEEFFELVVI
ncbi:insulinase family protein [Ginsengibacter hankyongi]|uniref:Insulinase family protein n=1 Tax=Ginsengibacter hankyongi TaxID=2607284 RepID=A0A5J5IR25_9BACT|nr:pitrilysin family protein [Ginsengibacter hankyongi]KAA9042012.1 insulinase family protein [Ginsengibacter hankyongi]